MKNYALQILVSLLSYLVPKDRKLMVLGAGDAKQFQGNPKYILQYLRRHPEFPVKCYWSSKSEDQQKQLKEWNIPYVNPYSFEGFWKILRAQYLFIEKSAYDVYYTGSIRGRFKFIQTWHGSPLKKIGLEDLKIKGNSSPLKDPHHPLFKFLIKIRFFSRQKYHLILASSKFTREIYERVFYNKRVQITGYPRNDVLFNAGLATQDYASVFDFKKYKKVILYAPTFRDNLNTFHPFSGDLNEFNEALKKRDYLFVVKKHPWQKNLEISSLYSHIKDVSFEVDDIQELFLHTDVLVTDYSGTFSDFVLLDRPIIFYAFDFEEYLKTSRTMYLDYFKDLPGPFATSEEELFQLIFEVERWSRTPDYQKRYDKLKQRYNQFYDGHSTERMLKLLYPDLLTE